MSHSIDFSGIKKDIAGRRLLDIAELSLRTSECIVLSGNNGSGKTTLLKILAGLLAPESGTVRYRGRSVVWPRVQRELRRHSVYLHQHPYMFDASVERNVSYGLRRLGWSSAEVAQRVVQVLEWSGLNHLAHQNARTLSGGERQRVALARARVLAPQWLLLDEPTSNMDREAREQTYFLIQRLKGEDIGILLTTHESVAISQLGDRHLRLSSGKLHSVDVPAKPMRDIHGGSSVSTRPAS